MKEYKGVMERHKREQRNTQGWVWRNTQLWYDTRTHRDSYKGGVHLKNAHGGKKCTIFETDTQPDRGSYKSGAHLEGISNCHNPHDNTTQP